MTDRRRITLIVRNPKKVQRDWDFTNPAGSKLVFVDSMKFLPYALDRGVKSTEYDVERVIIDGTATALQFLEFLSMLPPEFAGDVISIGEDGKSFLSSVGRGDGRLLYSLTEKDFNFYLQVNSLTWPVVPGAQLQPREFALA
jgi:hypothetical protein